MMKHIDFFSFAAWEFTPEFPNQKLNLLDVIGQVEAIFEAFARPFPSLAEVDVLDILNAVFSLDDKGGVAAFSNVWASLEESDPVNALYGTFKVATTFRAGWFAVKKVATLAPYVDGRVFKVVLLFAQDQDEIFPSQLRVECDYTERPSVVAAEGIVELIATFPPHFVEWESVYVGERFRYRGFAQEVFLGEDGEPFFAYVNLPWEEKQNLRVIS